MVFSKPKIYEVHAFDATQPYTFKFSYTGSQAEWNELRIENANGETVYKQRITSRLASHKIPENTLTNNKSQRYKVYVTVGVTQKVEHPVYGEDSEGNQIIVSTEIITSDVASAESDWISFYCFDSPILQLNDLSQNQVINSSTLLVSASYLMQANSDQLNSYEIVLYDALGHPISSSDVVYVSGATDFEYEITGLEDNQSYYIQITGETLNHLVAYTDRIAFSVEYVNPSLFAKLSLTNLPKEGQIKLQSNIVSILGKCGPTSRTGVLDDGSPAMPIYIDNGEVDITGEGHWVAFDESFDISGDFTMQIILRNPNPYTDILTMYDGVVGETGPLITVPVDDDPYTEDVIENDPVLTNIYDGVYASDMASPPRIRVDANVAPIEAENITSVERLNKVITLKYMLGDFVTTEDGQSYIDATVKEMAYIALRVDTAVLAFTTYSNLIDVPSEQIYLHIWLQRKNNLYSLIVEHGDGGVD